jgi:chlorite dismutase
MQEMTARLLTSGIGCYSEISYQLFGYTRPSVYTRRPTSQEQAIDLNDRQTYLIVYPFSKTTDWYLMSRDARQGMMNEHMRVGHEYADIRQVLLYATGLDDQEFVVAYETEDPAALQPVSHRPARDRSAPFTRCAIRRSSPLFTDPCARSAGADWMNL